MMGEQGYDSKGVRREGGIMRPALIIRPFKSAPLERLLKDCISL